MDAELLSRRDVERLYGLKKTRFYQLLHSGALRAVKVGSRTFVRREDADHWAKSLPDYQPQGVK